MNKIASLLLAASLGLVAVPAMADSRCGDCGKISRIDTVTGHRSKVGGAIIGGIAGAVIGNQIGGGDGKKVATVAGAAGGAYAGNKIAGNMEKQQYEITVKMDDGHRETVVQNSIKGLGVGSSVRIRNGKVVHL
jgi:outer membrane lipoprotein SlyB